MEFPLAPLLLLLLFYITLLAIPVILVLLLLAAAQRNWNSVAQKEKVVNFVGFWKRLAIGIVDMALSLFVVPLFLNLYFYIRDGQTIGGKMYGVRLVDAKTLKTASVGKLIIRELAKTLSALCFGIGFFAAGVRTEKRAWHDGWAEVRYVAYKKRSWIWTFLPLFLFFVFPILMDAIRLLFS